ncbi:hypothetical protein I3843_09G085800 [Carya illinoinensis]|nr:hypothetical protein I3843_09G085800 [Carya illinoinensis]
MYVCYHICHATPIRHAKYVIYYMYVKSCNIHCCKYVMLNMLSIICYAMLRNVSISSWSCISSYVQVTFHLEYIMFV